VLFLYSEKQNNCKTTIGQKFRLTAGRVLHNFSSQNPAPKENADSCRSRLRYPGSMATFGA